MPRWILLLLVAVAIFAGCSSEEADKPGGAWAMALCARVSEDTFDTSEQGPLPYELLDARVVTKGEAKALDGGFLPSDATEYAASCKIRFLQPYNGTIRAGAALLAFEGGSNSFVLDPYWAK